MRPTWKKRRDRPAPSHPTDRRMLYLLAGAIAAGLLVWIAVSGAGSRDSEPIAKIPVSWTVLPVWPKGAQADRAHGRPPRGEPQTLAVYLDVSEPMGGFLPPASGAAQPSAFRAVVLSLVPEQMLRLSKGSGTRFEWILVAAGSRPADRPRTLTRGMFNGEESRLNEAIAAILRGFDEGRLETAALITDLISTEGLTGAMGAAMPLSDYMASAAVRRGEFHLGFLGIRAPYWGARSKSCRPAGELGCWFSEQAQQYKPLTRATKVPFYVLIMGRGFEAVQEIGEGIRAGAVQLGLEAHWDLLTEVAQTRPLAGAECTVHRAGRRGEPQYVLVRQEEGGARCQQADEVEILCSLPAGAALEPQRAAASWPGVGAALEGKGVLLQLDCGALRPSFPAGDLTVKIDGPPLVEASQWRNWTCESDDREEDLGRTLQLMSFLDTVRPKPERLEIVSGTLLGGH